MTTEERRTNQSELEAAKTLRQTNGPRVVRADRFKDQDEARRTVSRLAHDDLVIRLQDEQASSLGRRGAEALRQKRLDNLPEVVAGMMRKELKKNGGDYKAAAHEVYSKAVAARRKTHKREGITASKQAVADRLGVNLSTVKRHTRKRQ